LPEKKQPIPAYRGSTKLEIFSANQRLVLAGGGSAGIQFDPNDDPTNDQLLEIINQQHALTPQSSDQVYLFRMQLSSQNLDSYNTRMSASTLKNYQGDFSEGRPLMNSHRTDGAGFLSSGNAELPIGRFVLGKLSGTPLNEATATYATTGGQALRVYGYIQRGLSLSDVNTDHVIQGIEGGTVKSASVGFAMGADSRLQCSVCGLDMRDWSGDCTHMPGVDYGKLGRAFGWVQNAHAVEGSLVFAGSTPDAMIEKAIRMVRRGKLSRRDALQLEETYQARIMSGQGFVMPEGKKEVRGMDFKEFFDMIKGLPFAETIRTATDESEQVAGVIGGIRALESKISDLSARAALGDAWVKDLVDQAVQQRVRAVGQGKFDEVKYRDFLSRSADPEFIKGEISSYSAIAAQTLGGADRPTRAAGLRTEDQIDPPENGKRDKKSPTNLTAFRSGRK